MFPGITQGVAVLGLAVGGKTQKMVSYGPLTANDISPEVGLSRSSPSINLERGSWSSWTDATWAVPRMPIDSFDRKKVIEAIGRLADKPRLSEEGNWLNPDGSSVRLESVKLTKVHGQTILMTGRTEVQKYLSFETLTSW